MVQCLGKWDLTLTQAHGGAIITNINITQALTVLEGPQIDHLGGQQALGKKPPSGHQGHHVWHHMEKYLCYSAEFWLKLSKLQPPWTSLCEGCGRGERSLGTRRVGYAQDKHSSDLSNLFLPTTSRGDATSFLHSFTKLKIQDHFHSSIFCKFILSLAWRTGKITVTSSPCIWQNPV